ncbi:MAG: efflux RND transporter permease subunit [Pseudomonadota bacterium]|nr:efflux RND transporter permease subunit [Pseudomonadota bacterium]
MTIPTKASHSRVYGIFARWAAACYRHAAWILLAAAVLAVACALYTARNLVMDTDTTDMLSEHLPFRANDERYRKAFPQDADIMLLVLEAPTPEQAHIAAKGLSARLKNDTSNFQDVYAPNVDDFLIRNGLLYEDIAELEQITDRLAAAQPLIAQIAKDPSLEIFASVLTRAVEELGKGQSFELRPVLNGVSATLEARLAGQPRALSWQSLFSGEPQKNRYQQLIMVKPVLDYTQLFPAELAITALRNTAQELGITDDSPVRLHITGEVALSHEELNSSLSGMEYAGALSLLLVAAVLYAGMRAARAVLVILLSLVLGLVLTAAFATVAVGHLNVISIAFAVLYIGLGVDYAIHFLMRYREILESGLPAADAMREAGGEAGDALAACALTTSIGFYAFMPTAFRGVAELGLISGTGMLISLFITLTLVPALQRYLPTPPAAVSGAEESLGKLLEFTLRWRKWVYAVTLAGLVGAVAVLPQIEFDYNLLNMQNPEGQAVQAFRKLLADPDNSPWQAVALARGLDEAEALAQRLSKLPEVSRVVTILDFVPTGQDEKLPLIEEMALTMGPIALAARSHAADEQQPLQQRTALDLLASALDRFITDHPEHSSAAAGRSLKSALTKLFAQLDAANPNERLKLLQSTEEDLLLALPTALQSLRAATEAAPFEQRDLPASLGSRWHSQSGEYRVAIYPAEDIKENQALRRFVRAVQKVAPQATGAPMVSLEAGEAVVEAFVQAFTLALAGIMVTLWVLLRSIAYSLLVLAPLLLATIFTGALTVLLNVPFNFANIIALPLLLGIGIDSALHMVHRSRNGGSIQENLIHTSTTRAIVYSAMTTLAGFGSLMFSSHQGTASMGVLLTVGLIFTLISTLVILPALMRATTHDIKG